jgi:hypothetical protein
LRTTTLKDGSSLGWRNSGLPYHSPHKFRHGFAVYALKNTKDVPALKAVSQNLMHENLSVTDGIYGILSENDVRDRIATLGTTKDNECELNSVLLADLLRKLLNQISLPYINNIL